MLAKIISALAILALLAGLSTFVGCSLKAPVCTVTPIDIEELKADNRDIDKELATVSERLAQKQAELAAKQATRDERAAVPPQLKLELRRLKQASGVTEKIEETVKEPEQAKQIEIRLPTRNSQ